MNKNDKDQRPAAYQPTEPETVAVDGYLRRRAADIVPRLKVLDMEDGRQGILPDHPDVAIGIMLLAEDLGVDRDSMRAVLQQVGYAAKVRGKIDEVRVNAMISAVRSAKPRDHVELMLALQMAAIHTATMDTASQLAGAQNQQVQEVVTRQLNSLARTFTTQMEAIGRYRSGGGQRVAIGSMTVSDGGQAIVGRIDRSDAARGRDAGRDSASADRRRGSSKKNGAKIRGGS